MNQLANASTTAKIIKDEGSIYVNQQNPKNNGFYTVIKQYKVLYRGEVKMLLRLQNAINNNSAITITQPIQDGYDAAIKKCLYNNDPIIVFTEVKHSDPNNNSDKLLLAVQVDTVFYKLINLDPSKVNCNLEDSSQNN